MELVTLHVDVSAQPLAMLRSVRCLRQRRGLRLVLAPYRLLVRTDHRYLDLAGTTSHHGPFCGANAGHRSLKAELDRRCPTAVDVPRCLGAARGPKRRLASFGIPFRDGRPQLGFG